MADISAMLYQQMIMNQQYAMQNSSGRYNFSYGNMGLLGTQIAAVAKEPPTKKVPTSLDWLDGRINEIRVRL